MEKIERIKELVETLNKASDAYYVNDNPIMPDKKYDVLYDELEVLEKETGYILASSVTQKVQGKVLDGFQKITHSKPMLSAAKTKNINEIKKFVGNNAFYCSYKLDGLTLVTIYEGGEFKKAVTRGTGLIGEDVTEQAKTIANLPMHIPYDDYLELRGECVVSWDNFRKINEGLDEPYSHPRNLAAGGLRNLDTNITKQRNLSYVVFECVSDLNNYDPAQVFDSKWHELQFLKSIGFNVVDACQGTVEDCVEAMQPELYKYPVDGLIFEMVSKKYSKSLASTGHHEGCRMALKWADSVYDTVLRDVVWDVGRSGVISPVAVFDEIDLDGALTTRATLHNLSIIEGLELGIGDTITVYRSNMVIPKIDDNLTRSNTLAIPQFCPCCGEHTEIKYTDNIKFLVCPNSDCTAKLVAKFTHFVGRDCMNIEGLSEATLEGLIIGSQWISEFKDIYHLKEYRCLWAGFPGFGEKSVDKILDAIEKSRDVKLENFICALSIDGVGKSASKTISDAFDGDFNAFYEVFKNGYNWADLQDIGDKTASNITKYLTENETEIVDLASEMRFVVQTKVEAKENPFSGKILCVTGKLSHFTRDSINAKINELGAKSASSVSKNTDYLITNEASGSSKYKKAVELNIPIITEQEFLNMIGE